jgi:hypothetical protein
MCFNEPFEDLLQKTRGTLMGDGDGKAMYKQSLQVEDITIAGSLLYSHHDVQIERLCDKLSRMSGYHMSAHWKAADMGRLERHDPIRLMHIECSAKHKMAAQRFLEAIYNSNHHIQFPLGINIRFICDMHEAVGMYGQDKQKSC